VVVTWTDERRRAARSDPGSDFYEELLVNPVLLTFARQRGAWTAAG
jgi:hypothetical protein